MEGQIVPYVDRTEAMVRTGLLANEYAREGEFSEYWSSLSANAQDTREAALRMWADYVKEATGGASVFTVEELRTDPQAWKGTTYGYVKGFKLWLGKPEQGFSVGTINNRLSAVRVFAKLAFTAGAISEEEAAKIAGVKGYSSSGGMNLDEEREVTRVEGRKKAESVVFSDDDAEALMTKQPKTAQGVRDSLLMALLIEDGLRVSEVALLDVTKVNMSKRRFSFYRPKKKEWDQHQFMDHAGAAFEAYMTKYALPKGRLLLTSNKHGTLGATGMSERAIQERVRVLGQRVGIGIKDDEPGLSPHDCRHYAATLLAESGATVLDLMRHFGWSSPAMAVRYVKKAEIGNERTAQILADKKAKKV